MNTRQTLAIIGSGPSCIYVLKNILDRAETFKKHLASIDIFEKRRVAGMGMPYNPETTARENMCNITSEEMPALLIPFVDWLKGLDATHLAEFDIQPEEISDKEVYSRLALGEYFHAQYQSILASLSNAGISVRDRAHCTVVDIIEQKDAAIVVDKESKQFSFDHVVVATGHYWPEQDHPGAGYYQSPWPISKILPSPEEFYNFKVGTLGASLSAFDVVSSLARSPRRVREECGTGLAYRPSPGTESFKICHAFVKGAAATFTIRPKGAHAKDRTLRKRGWIDGATGQPGIFAAEYVFRLPSVVPCLSKHLTRTVGQISSSLA